MPNTILIQTPKTLPPKLLVCCGDTMQVVDLKEYQTIGRTTNSNTVDIDLHMGHVSRRHGEIGHDARGWYYTDTNSGTGTYLGSRKVNPGERCDLTDGDVLRICNEPILSNTDAVTLVFLTDYPPVFTTGSIPLSGTAEEITIGRSFGEKLAVGDGAVSAHHASFFLADAGWAVVDHRSTNGVFINNRRILQPEYLQYLQSSFRC